MARKVGIAVLSTVACAAVLSSFLKWLKDLKSEVLDLKKGMEERRPSVNSEVLDQKKVTEERRPSVSPYAPMSLTTSLPDELDGFYGRDDDKEAIIRRLLLSDDACAGNLGVIPIVGMGGVGKTTLAQHVYNDKAVAEQFKVRAWVCVSDQFDVTKVTREIVRKVVTGEACPSDDLDQLQCKLKCALDGEKFLLVLDDVWSEDYNGWTKLLIPLRSGAEGSKIVITTRNKKVASKVRTGPTHDLEVLKDEDCWKLFARHAFLDVNSAANPPEELQEIGKKIVRKCGGLPLAAKALGGVLRCETEAKKWKEVLESEIWVGDVRKTIILPSLAISYINLPSHLKRCFAYCAMFPQDYVFKKEELVALWMSEGFLVQQKGKKSLEEIGDRYFDDLVSRSFFQPSSIIWSERCFAMHDLVHDLARFVSGEFCYRLEEGTSSKIGERTRHLYYGRIVDDGLGIQETPCLRSFVSAKKWGSVFVNEESIDGLLQTQRLLRVLSLPPYGTRMELLRVWSLPPYGTREVPNSIGNLKHMRYLNLSGSSIRLLPEAVTDLFNLEILILSFCRSLVELPADMARLINLCQLDLFGTGELKGMPPEMGKLKKLSKLSDFVVGENGGSSIKELGNLHNLRGEIRIWGLKNVKDDRDASEAILKDKKNLKVLELKWKREDDSRQKQVLEWKWEWKREDDSRQKQVLERLQPHTDIESIKIDRYGGREFPNWVGGIFFSELKVLHIWECSNLVCFPGEGLHAPNLKSLRIQNCGALKCLPRGMQSLLPSLEELVIYRCPEIESFPEGGFPSKLRYVEIDKCKKLVDGDGRMEYRVKSLSSLSKLMKMEKRMKIEKCGNLKWLLEAFYSLLSSLEELELHDCPKLLSLPNNLPSLKRLRIRECGELESLVGSTATTSDPLFSPSLPSLEELNLSLCPKLLSLPNHLPSLKRLEISSCYELESLGESTATTSDPLFSPSLTCLEELDLYSCPKLLSLPPSLASLEVLKLHICPKLLSFPNHLPSLKRLRIWPCGEESLVKSTATTSDPLFSPSLTSLEELDLSHCPKLLSLPPLLTSLEVLKLQGCPKLLSLPNHLPSLKRLWIWRCGELESLVELTATRRDPLFSPSLTSLEELGLHYCPKLLSVPYHLPSLKQLRIWRCGELDFENSLISAGAALETIDIRRNGKVKCISLETFPKLKELRIKHCYNLESLGSTTAAVAATTTRTSDPLFFASLTSICPELRSMEIRKCVNLKWLPQGMHFLLPSLEELSISGCPEIESFPEGGLPSKLQSLFIAQCNKLVGGRMQWGLQSLPSLSTIVIRGGLCEGVESSFPEETLLPSSLNYLEIHDFPKMKSLNYKGLQHLSSLQSLKIFKCQNLESLPEEGLPSSLSSLEIGGCPLLEKRCEREIGEYWPKIQHIHHFEIGDWETSDGDLDICGSD